MSLELPPARQQRCVFFVFDGGVGLGHLRRLAHIARALQGPCSCLVVTGHRQAADWFISADCEYVHLPSWDSLLPQKAAYWGRDPFLNVPLADAVSLRKEIIGGIVRGFRPDAIFVDHLPLGANEELLDVIQQTPARKYLVTRGVLNETEDLDRLILGGAALEALRSNYDRILVAADHRIVDFASTYALEPGVAEKIVNTGYIVDPIPDLEIERARAERGLGSDDVWVVASAGGGQTGEQTILASIEIARAYPAFAFDIILGPRSSLSLDQELAKFADGSRVRILKEVPDMALRHAGADIVITSGGYNSMLEAMQGKALILCVPLRKDPTDEQQRHIGKLAGFVDIKVTANPAALADIFASTVASHGSARPDRRCELEMDGAGVVRQIVLGDLFPK